MRCRRLRHLLAGVLFGLSLFSVGELPLPAQTAAADSDSEAITALIRRLGDEHNNVWVVFYLAFKL